MDSRAPPDLFLFTDLHPDLCVVAEAGASCVAILVTGLPHLPQAPLYSISGSDQGCLSINWKLVKKLINQFIHSFLALPHLALMCDKYYFSAFRILASLYRNFFSWLHPVPQVFCSLG